MDHKNLRHIIDKIEVPKEDVFRAIEMGIQQGEQKNRRNSYPRKKFIVSCAIAASFMGLIFSSGFINPKMNQVLAMTPIIGAIYEQFGDKMGLDLARQNLITELDQSVTKNGVTVKLNNAYFDGGIVSITGHVSGELEKGINEEGELSIDVNFENGKADHDLWLHGKSTQFKETEKGFEFQWKLNYPYETIKEDFTLPIAIHYINGIKGDWNFDIPITQAEHKTLAINHSRDYQEEGVQININDIKIANASSVLNLETVSKYEDDKIDIKKAVDDKGNILFQYVNNTILSQTKEKNGFHVSAHKTISKINEHVQSITFYPTISIFELPVQQLLNISTFLLESERTALAIKVNSVTAEGNKIIVDYNFEGFPNNLNNHRADLVLHNLSCAFNLIDNDFMGEIDPENPMPPENHSISKNEVRLLDKKTYHYQSVFRLDGEEQIENFALENTVLQFNFTSFIEIKELAPFTVELSK
ncbi:DUF4179 domain-containing protein [Lysinibacillus sp. NPDC096418]|uniref:DUF4179 domain-containing protein n=1 Tax=Lysinibacillus sp. NPDC096418 TaxID=3364138 RepID=UPI003818DEE8